MDLDLILPSDLPETLSLLSMDTLPSARTPARQEGLSEGFSVPPSLGGPGKNFANVRGNMLYFRDMHHIQDGIGLDKVITNEAR